MLILNSVHIFQHNHILILNHHLPFSIFLLLIKWILVFLLTSLNKLPSLPSPIPFNIMSCPKSPAFISTNSFHYKLFHKIYTNYCMKIENHYSYFILGERVGCLLFVGNRLKYIHNLLSKTKTDKTLSQSSPSYLCQPKTTLRMYQNLLVFPLQV